MFVKKDTRKVAEILYDAKDARAALFLGRREAEFNGTTKALLDASNGASLSATTYLSLYGNKLTELAHVSTLAEHAPLEEINLGHNQLTSLPSSFGSLHSLRTLWAEDNLFAAFPTPLLRLTHLRTLRLSGNRLTHLPSELTTMTCLEELAIDNNALEALPEDVGALTALRVLLLRGNALTCIPASIGALTHLHSLSLSSNKLTALPEEMGACTSLRTLLVNSNALTALPSSLAACTSLTKLNAASNRIDTLPVELCRSWAASLPHELRAADADAPLPRFELVLDGNPILQDVVVSDAVAATRAVALSEAEYAQPLIHELRKRMRK